MMRIGLKLLLRKYVSCPMVDSGGKLRNNFFGAMKIIVAIIQKWLNLHKNELKVRKRKEKKKLYQFKNSPLPANDTTAQQFDIIL